MPNPVLVDVTRGGISESQHRGAYVVAKADGSIVTSGGSIRKPVFPRSAIKAFQALAVLESGAADQFGFTDEEIALCCSSHGGEERHSETARLMLEKLGLTEDYLECGGHWPTYQRTTNAMIANGERPRAIHNNCSGKHAGMLALAKHLGADPEGYIEPGHPVQRAVAALIEDLCDVSLARAPVARDGCSVPTWAIRLDKVAAGFARFAAGQMEPAKRRKAAKRIIKAVRAHPFMVAGTGRFCTDVMTAVPRAFVKTGAEGVYCGCIPHAGLGFALKCEDGATRAAEMATAGLLNALPVWNAKETKALREFMQKTLLNRRRFEIGEVRPAKHLQELQISL